MDAGPAVASACGWLDSLDLPDERDDALRTIGLQLAAAQRRREPPRLPGVATTTLPSAAELVTMERDELVGSCNRIARSQALESSAPCDAQRWEAVLPALCISYARDADPVAVASLVRVAARLRVEPALLDEAVSFLLEQQTDDGSFGLLADSAQSDGSRLRQSLRITVEVLWALAAVAERVGRSGGSSCPC